MTALHLQENITDFTHHILFDRDMGMDLTLHVRDRFFIPVQQSQ